MSEKIIELRQRNVNTKVNQNGDFEIKIPPLKLMKNDSVQIKQAFIDTISRESGKIIIPDGVDEISFNFLIYLQDQDSTRGKAGDIKDYLPATANTPTGKNYVLCSQDDGSNGGGVTMCSFTELQLMDQSDNSRFIRDKYMKLRLVYKDAAGIEKPFNAEIRAKEYYTLFPNSGQDLDGQTVNIALNSSKWHDSPPQGLICQKDAYGTNTPLKYASGGEKDAHDGKFSFVKVNNITTINSDKVYTPWEFTTTIPIPENTALEPNEFCKLISRGLNRGANADGTIPASELTSNLILQTQQQLKARGQKSDGSAPNLYPYFVREDGEAVIQYKTVMAGNPATDQTPNLLFGSSNFDIGFDLETNMASIDQLHSAIYSGGNECVVPMNIAGNRFILNKTGGIIITSCSQNDLLTKGLNIPPSYIGKVVGHRLGTIAGLGHTAIFPKFFLADGINVTSHSTFLDTFIQKGSNPANNQDTFDTVPNFQASAVNYSTNSGIISDDINSIHAQVPVGEDEFADLNSDVGYYQIEIDTNANFDKVSNDRNSRKIAAIVNKYYSTNNYTIGDSSMSTPYIHNEDEPLLITDLKVRFLTPDNLPVDPSTLQDDNTIFLSVTSNNPE